MKFAAVEEYLKGGGRLMVNLPKREDHGRTYNLDHGAPVSARQFEKLSEHLAPYDPPLIPGEEPQSYIWRH